MANKTCKFSHGIIVFAITFSVLFFGIRYAQNRSDPPLIRAILSGDADTAKKFMTPEEMSKQGKMGRTALRVAAATGQTEIVRALINAGVNVNEQDMLGTTAIQRAAGKGYMEIADMLLSAGADPNLQDKLGNTALMFVALEGARPEMVKKLVDAGVNINKQDKMGVTTLLDATRKERTEIVKVLIDAGADVNIQDKFGDTALDVAIRKGHTEIADMLKAAGTGRNENYRRLDEELKAMEEAINRLDVIEDNERSLCFKRQDGKYEAYKLVDGKWKAVECEHSSGTIYSEGLR